MAKKIPEWQQVLLVALNNVPHRQDGHDAWNRLNEEEQAAVRIFLIEHCGEEAAALEETCGQIKHPKWWVYFWMIFSFVLLMVAGMFVFDWFEAWTGMKLTPFLWLLVMCPGYWRSAWKGDPTGEAQEVWKHHEATRAGTAAALKHMYYMYTSPPEARRSRDGLIYAVALTVLWGFAAALEIAEQRPPAMPERMVASLEAVADGLGSMEDAESLLENYGNPGNVQHISQAWDKTVKWSDERYLAAAWAVRHNHPNAAEYAREALLTTRLGAIDTPAEAAEFAAMLALCDAETVQSVRERVEAAEFPEKAAVLAVFE